ncbi:YncE family protein, partial [Pseudomonas sp. P155]
LDPFEATRAIRESIHSDILRVGEPRQELPQPEVAGVVDGVLPADTAGTTATVIYKETVKDDEIFMSWLGSITGEYPDSIKLNEFTAGKEVPFTIPAAMIKGNEGGTVEVKYEIKRAAGGTSYSDTLTFSVGVALDLKEPKIKEAPNDTSLDPLDAQSALTAVIDYDGMLVGDKIIVRWIGATGTLPAGSHTTDTWPVTTVGPQEIPLAVSVIAFNLDKSITLDYSVTRGTQDPKDSRTRTLAVLQLRVDLSHSPKIIQAADGGDGTELEVSTLTAAATARSGFWPHIANGQPVWMEVKSTKEDDTEYKRVVWRGQSNAVNVTWISQGYLDASLPLADLQSLKHQSELTVTFKTTPDRSMDENLALSFPVRTYTVSAGQIDTPTFTNAPYTIAPAGRLKNIELLLSSSSDTPVPGGKLSLTLPAQFRYADGSSGQREFITNDVGRVSVSGVKGALNPGSYDLSVTSGSKTDNTTITVTEPGPIVSIRVPGSPHGIAFTPDGTRVYVSNYTSDTISVIDTATNLVLTNIPVERDPAGIVVSPDGTRAYVCCNGSNSILVIDVATNRVLTTFPVEGHPVGVAFSPDGSRAYTSNFVSSTVSVIDTVMDRVLTNISTDEGPYGIAVNSNGTRTYVCNHKSNTVSVIDTTTNQFLTNITVGRSPISIAVRQDGTRAYVCGLSDTVSVIDMATNRVLKNIPVGDYSYCIAVSQDGTRAYFGGHSGTVSVIDTATDRVLRSIPVGQSLQVIALSPDGTRAYISASYSQQVFVIDTAPD